MRKKSVPELLVRDISWLSFNARVLQEAEDPRVPLYERLRFLGIFSNNLDEFFRVRVAALNRMLRIGKEMPFHSEEKPAAILKEIQQIVLSQQESFERIYADVQQALKKEKIAFVSDTTLNAEQRGIVRAYFNDKVRTNLFPIMIESVPELPLLSDRAIYLACTLSNSDNSFMNSYALIEIPSGVLPRFKILPGPKGFRHIILLEDIIRLGLPDLFTQFGFNWFEGSIIKVTRDAELDLDVDLSTDVIQKLEKGLKNRKKGKAVRFVYDKQINKNLLAYLTKLLNLSKKDPLIPGGRIHNFKDFMSFPEGIIQGTSTRKAPFIHPLLKPPVRILHILDERDILLHFPYHSFDSLIDLLRESAIDPNVTHIRITCYRLAKESKIVNALLNAVRNGKKVSVVIELRARFDEEANLRWKRILEEEGVYVIVGLPNRKIHAKLCLITKRIGKKTKLYGFVSTGNMNENTARIYGDHCLLTSNKQVMSDIARVFQFIENQSNDAPLKLCQTLLVSPFNTRHFFKQKIADAVKSHLAGKKAGIIIKLNSLSDDSLIHALYKAAEVGLPIQLIIRGICCAKTNHPSWPAPIQAISIVDEYLEHARVIYFAHDDSMYLSSADWMMRNLDHRIEASLPITDPALRAELLQILQFQLQENVKARVLNNAQNNEYVKAPKGTKPFRSQIEIYEYLQHINYSIT
ncbi:MAG: polyphosphate kinase 1 [Chitinophagaceae bacterium]